MCLAQFPLAPDLKRTDSEEILSFGLAPQGQNKTRDSFNPKPLNEALNFHPVAGGFLLVALASPLTTSPDDLC